MEKTKVQPLEKKQVKKARLFKVVFLNDDYTTFEFVSSMFFHFFNKPKTEADELTTEVHKKGRAIAGVYSKEIAGEKIQQVHDIARKNQYPLKLILEPEE